MPAHPPFNQHHYTPQQWPLRPSDDRSDPRSLSSDASVSVSVSASATMSPVSSQDESVALPAKAVCPAQCAYGWECARQWDASARYGVESPQGNRLSVYSDSEDDEEDDKESENAFVVLLRLSFLAPPFSLVAALYTLFVLLFLTVTTPVRLCFSPTKPTSSLRSQILHLLVPFLRRHKRLITTLTPAESRRARHPYHRSPSPSEATSYSPTVLVLIHLLSPLLILPILFAAWIAAFFWIFAMILGNPDGTERRDDGRAAVLGVRNWWRIWLRKADREVPRERSRRPEMTQTQAQTDAAARV